MLLEENQWRIFQDRENAWNWKFMTPAGQIIGTSARGYKTRTECLDNARRHGYIGN